MSNFPRKNHRENGTYYRNLNKNKEICENVFRLYDHTYSSSSGLSNMVYMHHIQSSL